MPYVRKRFWEPYEGSLRMISKHGDTILIDPDDYALVEQYFISVSSKASRIRQVLLNEKTRPYHRVGMHRVILRAKKGQLVDHINHNRFDNRKCNLRICNAEENARNRQKTTRKCSSRFKGVYWNAQGVSHWHAYLYRRTGKSSWRQVPLGTYKIEEDAARAYDKAAMVEFGDYAHLNFNDY